ncbi:TPA: hypothetical protein NGW16_004172 [Vibrio parahaemolyticus]|nr:hypothetical protein [Vibrio parahaemolyticus]
MLNVDNIETYNDYLYYVNANLSSIIAHTTEKYNVPNTKLVSYLDNFSLSALNSFIADKSYGSVETKVCVYNQITEIIDDNEFSKIPVDSILFDKEKLNEQLREDLNKFIEGEKNEGIVLTHTYIFKRIEFINSNTLARFKVGKFSLKVEKILMVYDFLKAISDGKIYFDYLKGEFINEY